MHYANWRGLCEVEGRTWDVYQNETLKANTDFYSNVYEHFAMAW